MTPRPKIKVSLLTNACAKDAPRLERILPHWARVFSGKFQEIVVIVDSRIPEGRIASVQKVPANLGRVLDVLSAMAKEIPNLRWQMLDYGTLSEVSSVWWKSGRPMRCQDGTPVFAFAAGFLAIQGPMVLRMDCDMLFRDPGWLDAAVESLAAGKADVVSPPRVGETVRVSSRAFLLDWPGFRARFLPMNPARLDWLRRVHRRLRGRSAFLTLEDSLIDLVASGGARHLLLADDRGTSMHVVKVQDAAAPDFEDVLVRWERGDIPEAQAKAGWDFDPSAWQSPI